MIVRFTKESASAFWQMVCNPSNQWGPEDWYRAEDPTGEVEMSRLHRFAEARLCKTQKVKIRDPQTQAMREIDEKEFLEGSHSLRRDLVSRAEKMIQFYRDKAHKGRGRILPSVFAELDRGLKNKPMPVEEEGWDDPDDAEELKKLEAPERRSGE